MNEVIGGQQAPGWFRVVALLAVLWNCLGVWQYLSIVRMVPMMMEPTAAQVAALEAAPPWYAGAFAIAVFAGLLGAVGLLLAKAWARSLLILALLAAVVKFSWWCFMSGLRESEGSAVFAMPAIVIAVAILLVWLANSGVRKGWLS